MNCEELEPLLAPYVDGEPGADRAEIDGHLRRCPPCASRAAQATAARRLVQRRSRALVPPAPPALRHRCAALARVRRSSWHGWLTLSRAALASAAGVLLVVATVGYAVVSGSQTLFVAGLTLDHIKCFAFTSSPATPPTADAVAAQLERHYGWRLAVPSGAGELRLDLVGARRCLSSDGTVAHVLYRHQGHPVSLFVLPGHRREPGALSLLGRDSRIWQRGETTFVLVGDEGVEALDSVARYFRAAAY